MHRFVLSAFLLPLIACAEVEGSGVSASEARDLDGFARIENAGLARVEARAGGDHAVTVVCDDDLIGFIRTEVVGDTLVVGQDPAVMLRPRVDCRVLVELPTLLSVENSGSGGILAGMLDGFEESVSSGSGAVRLEGIVGDHVSLTSSGSGRTVAVGVAVSVDVDSSGSGGVDAQDLAAEDATVVTSGSGSVGVTATRSVDVRLSGSGGVEVWGDPDQRVEDDSASGSITYR